VPFRQGTPYPLLKCVGTPKCRNLQLQSQDFSGMITLHIPAKVLLVLEPRHRFPLGFLAFLFFLFYETTVGVYIGLKVFSCHNINCRKCCFGNGPECRKPGMHNATRAGVTEICLPGRIRPRGKIWHYNLAPHYEDVAYPMTMSPPLLRFLPSARDKISPV